jgi:hypothetical protein
MFNSDAIFALNIFYPQLVESTDRINGCGGLTTVVLPSLPHYQQPIFNGFLLSVCMQGTAGK